MSTPTILQRVVQFMKRHGLNIFTVVFLIALAVAVFIALSDPKFN